MARHDPTNELGIAFYCAAGKQMNRMTSTAYRELGDGRSEDEERVPVKIASMYGHILVFNRQHSLIAIQNLRLIPANPRWHELFVL